LAEIDELTPGIYRICCYKADRRISFNQFLIDDELPTLIHTGQHPMYEQVRGAVAQVLDPGRLRYVVVPHFEADECGGMGRFVAEAAGAVLVCSAIGAGVNLCQWDFDGPVRGAVDGDTLELGRHRLRFLETPHVHHWDSMMVFEETTRSVFAADLFLQPGTQPAIVREDLAAEMCRWYRDAGLFAAEEPVRRVVDRLEGLDPGWIHPMHGGSLPREVLPRYVAALRDEPFAFDGRLFGRRLPQ
jgi:flavorubredoxin